MEKLRGLFRMNDRKVALLQLVLALLFVYFGVKKEVEGQLGKAGRKKAGRRRKR